MLATIFGRLVFGMGAILFVFCTVAAYMRLTQVEKPTKRYARDYFDMKEV